MRRSAASLASPRSLARSRGATAAAHGGLRAPAHPSLVRGAQLVDESQVRRDVLELTSKEQGKHGGAALVGSLRAPVPGIVVSAEGLGVYSSAPMRATCEAAGISGRKWCLSKGAGLVPRKTRVLETASDSPPAQPAQSPGRARYPRWIGSYIVFHAKRQPPELSATEVSPSSCPAKWEGRS